MTSNDFFYNYLSPLPGSRQFLEVLRIHNHPFCVLLWGCSALEGDEWGGKRCCNRLSEAGVVLSTSSKSDRDTAAKLLGKRMIGGKTKLKVDQEMWSCSMRSHGTEKLIKITG
jgi:hypothetical protein